MRWIAEIMPLCFVRWYARRNCELFSVGRKSMANPRPGVWIEK